MEYYKLGGATKANTSGPSLYSSTTNPVDGNSGIVPTVTVQQGYWNASSSTFSTTSSSGSVPAAKVIVTRTAAAGNAVPLIWGKLLGANACDVHAQAIAALFGNQSASLTIPATACLFLAGMNSGSSSFGGDTLSNAPPYQVTAIPVTPGTYISFTGMSGTTSVCPGSMPYVGPGGDTSVPVYHGESWQGTPDTPETENGFADALMYDSAAAGVFLTNNSPDQTTASTTVVDWTQTSQNNKAIYSNIQLQQPFMIGTGLTTGGAAKQFLVPAGATQLFIGIWDGDQYNNNSGSLTGTVLVNQYVQLVN